MKRILSLILSVAMLLTLLAGCTEKSSSTTETSGVTDTSSKFGGTLNIGVLADPDSLNPCISTDRVGAWLAEVQYPTLMRMDTEAAKVPYIAESIETSEDGLTVTVKLLEGLKWSDGTPITSADILFSYEYNYKNKLATQASSFEEVEEATCPDDLTVVFKLKRVFPTFITKVGFWVRIIPKHVWEKIEDPRNFANDQLPAVVFGPFKMVEAQRGQFYVLEGVDEFFLSPEGKPYLEKVIFRIYPDMNTMVLALKKGEIDVTAKEIPVAAAKDLKNDPNITVVENSSLGFNYLGFNMDNEFLSDVVLRQAIAISIDRNKVIQLSLEGAGMLADTPITPSFPQIHNPEAKIGDFNPTAATEMLTAAGYKDTDGDGVLNAPNGKNIELGLLYDGKDPYQQKNAQIVESNLKDIGVKVNQTPTDKASMSDLLFNQRKVDMNLGNWGIIDPLNDSLFTCYHTDTDKNFMGRPRGPIDDAIEGIRYAPSIDDQIVAAHAFQEEWLKEMSIATLYVQKFSFAYSNKFDGFTLFPSDLKGLVDPQSLCNVYKK